MILKAKHIVRSIYAAKMKLAEAGQLGLIPTRLLSQLGPVSTWPGQLGLVLFKVI